MKIIFWVTQLKLFIFFKNYLNTFLGIKCRDDTRIVLTYYENEGLNFIHANRISTPVLFNDFIITQAPMTNTQADFWRLVWQEGVKHIFMLISRDSAGTRKCAEYWPKNEGTGIECCGLSIINNGVDETRDPFFRVTTLTITDGTGKTVSFVFYVCYWYKADCTNNYLIGIALLLYSMHNGC